MSSLLLSPYPKDTLYIDVESTSPVDLAAAGADVYFQHPDTRIICVCWAWNDDPVELWRPGLPVPAVFRSLREVRIVAHNYLFEYFAWRHLAKHHGWVPCPLLIFWDCTMARALYWGLPAKLIDVARVCNLKHQIDKDKKSRILRMARPRAVLPDGTYRWWDEDDPSRRDELIQDCANDVACERELDHHLPALPEKEREIFWADGKINALGVRVDLVLVERLLALVAAEKDRLDEWMMRMLGCKTSNVGKITQWINAHGAAIGLPVPMKLDREAIGGALVDLKARHKENTIGYRVLAARRDAAKASTAKLKAFVASADKDARCRGLFQYAGAGRTRRWAGRRIQTQNFPRGGKLAHPTALADAIVSRGLTPRQIMDILPPGVSPMVAASELLRPCIIPQAGNVFVCADLAQIEARVVCWLAGQRDVLAVFARGEDVYVFAANKLRGTEDTKDTMPPAARQLGKVVTLACGFGMGGDKFQATAALYGIEMNAIQATDVVQAWRAANPQIVHLWYAVGRAALEIANAPHGREIVVNPPGAVPNARIIFRRRKKAMRIELPSGSELTYQYFHYDDAAEELCFMGVDPKTKQWSRQRTYGGKLVENITQATARDILGHALVELSHPHGPFHRIDGTPVGTTHDDIWGEVPDGYGRTGLNIMLETLRSGAPWTKGLPIEAEGWVSHRFKK
jgi:DNA polymerase